MFYERDSPTFRLLKSIIVKMQKYLQLPRRYQWNVKRKNARRDIQNI